MPAKPCHYATVASGCLSGCAGADAVARFFWPGSPPIDACALCTARAKAIADAMGFQLPMQNIMTGQEEGGPSRFQLLETD